MEDSKHSTQITNKICFLSLGPLYDLAKEVLSKLNLPNTEFMLYNCDLEENDRCSNEAIEAGCEVFIAGPGNAAFFRSHHNLPIFELPIRSIDYASAVRKAQKDGHKKIAISHYRYSAPIEMDLISSVLDIPIVELTFETMDELHNVIIDSECDAIVGAAGSVLAAEKVGKPSYLVYSGPDAIRDICIRASDYAGTLHENICQRQITHTVMQNSPIGIILTNENGVIDFFNRKAQEYTGFSSSQVRGSNIEDFFPNLSIISLLKSGNKRQDSYRLVAGAMMRCVQERIIAKNESIGVLISLYPEAHNKKKEKVNRRVGFSPNVYRWDELTALSIPMKRFTECAKELISVAEPIVLLGENGCGREEFACYMHYSSDRADAACITLDLASISESDAARLLFGYDRHDGYVEGFFASAAGGTIILKNVGLASPTAIACIQSVLSGHQMFHPGMKEPVSANIRFITCAGEEEFRQLQPVISSMLSVHILKMPPLRDRIEDIPELFVKYLRRVVANLPKRYKPTTAMFELMQNYNWPGNMRELYVVCVRFSHLAPNFDSLSPSAGYRTLIQAIGEENIFRHIIEEYPALMQRPIVEKDAFSEAISVLKKRLQYSNDEVASSLGLSRTTLWRLIKDEKNN